MEYRISALIIVGVIIFLSCGIKKKFHNEVEYRQNTDYQHIDSVNEQWVLARSLDREVKWRVTEWSRPDTSGRQYIRRIAEAEMEEREKEENVTEYKSRSETENKSGKEMQSLETSLSEIKNSRNIFLLAGISGVIFLLFILLFFFRRKR